MSSNLNRTLNHSLASLVLYFTTDDDHPSASSHEQESVEYEFHQAYRHALVSLHKESNPSHPLLLHRDRHLAYLDKVTHSLPKSMVSLSASCPWLVYWILHSYDLLSNGSDRCIPESLGLRAASTVLRFQFEMGGFGGGVGQRPHLAATYAAVHALAMTRDHQVWKMIDRVGMYRFLMKCKQPNGSFIVCEGGEIDIRGSYCALTVARLLNILTPELTKNCTDFIVGCQSYDGGIAALPHLEAHGGYTFCGAAASMILGTFNQLNMEALHAWSIRRQMQLEGGFQGRPNKLVDGCYSWWIGGLLALLNAVLIKTENSRYTVFPSWNQVGLQEYILVACQAETGGLLDKIGKQPDPYHTCYVLSGLAAAQFTYRMYTGPLGDQDIRFETCEDLCVVGPVENLLHPVDLIHNIRMDALDSILTFFANQ